MMKKIALIFAVAAIGFGAFAAETVPCTFTIDSREAFDHWLSVDANNDGDPYKFIYSTNGYALYTQNTKGAANDWMISPAVTLEAGVSYTITVSVQNISTYGTDKQDFSICAGKEQTVDAMTTEIDKVTGLTKTSWAVDRPEKPKAFTPAESGEYYFGVNLTSNSYMGDFALYSLKVEKAPVRPGAVTDLAVEAAPKGALSAVLTWTWPSVSDNGGALASITGAKIYRGTSSYGTTVIATVDADATPGSTGTYTDSAVPGNGKYYYKVVPFNADGESTTSVSAVQSPYIGTASGVSITNVVATAVDGSDTSVSLTWNGPTASGEGYFDPADVAYNISRTKDSGSAVTLEENWQGSLPYVDSTIDGLGAYKYTVKTIYNGSTSWSGVQSNEVVTGGTAALPYSNDFSSSASGALFTFFHGPAPAANSNNWKISNNALNYWGGTTADAWAATPKFSLMAGKAYKVSFTTHVNRSTSPKNLAVAVGTEPTAEALTEVILDEIITNTLYAAKEAIFSVPDDGDYCVGFHCHGASDSNDIYVDDLKIEEVATAPLRVADAKAEAAPLGGLKAIVSWTNPVKTTAGGEIATVDKVTVSSGSKVEATLTAVEAGSVSSVEIAVSEPGVYTFTITAYLNENASETVEVKTGWVGYDTPKAPESVTVSNGDDGERIIDFTPVTEGVNGGYIDLGNLKYTVKRNDEVLTADQTDSPYVDSEEITELAMYTYAVAAINGDYAGDFTSAAPVTLGNALGLPYDPDFSTSAPFELWTSSTWKYNSSDKAYETTFKSDSWAFTPPMVMKIGECSLTFRATCYNYRYPSDAAFYLVSSTELPIAGNAQKIGESHIESTNYPDAVEFNFPVERTGNYYIAVGDVTDNAWKLSLKEFSVKQIIDNSTAIDEVDAAATGEVRYFDLQGRRLSRPAKGGVVIVSRDGKTTKEIYRNN